ncbi:MAG TPA: BREX-1 system adenine-specific DNA-methyltransferase PglX [Methanothermobacter sp.]|nr:BREX-1 system adenine-specific DNA-methyltransferase PglX [Methanothermobacter sp.]
MKLDEISEARQGMIPGNAKAFIRLWFEVDSTKIGFNHESSEDISNYNKKWFPYNKGGPFQRWFGNIEHLIDMENNGQNIKYSGQNKNYRLRDPKYYFKEAITWSKVSGGNFSARYMPKGCLFDIAGCCVFELNENLSYVLAFFNSIVTEIILNFISPTLNFEVDHIKKLPVIFSDKNIKQINYLVDDNITISKVNWDNYETSWDFKHHPFLNFQETLIKNCFKKWESEGLERFNNLKYNEKKINEIFIDIYDLKEELSPEIKDSEVTINKADLSKDIKRFISYALGCILGRYSLDKEGLIYAGGQWDPSRYSKFLPDDDNIIPILDSEYFEDDIVGRFVEFIKVTFGEDNLEENLDFIAKALKKKGTTSREVIRNYFLTDFYKDHLKTYKKHPIYWLFDSGRNNGFKALIYMHRYEPDLVARVRTDYLHKTQKAMETAIAHNDRIIETSTSTSEKSKAVKAKNKLVKQLKETKKYDEALAHIANQKIEIDLDDGVKVNYAKFQGVEVSSEGQKAKKINLLKPI